MTRPRPVQGPSLRMIGWRALRALALLMIGAGIGFGFMSEVKPGRGSYNPDSVRDRRRGSARARLRFHRLSRVPQSQA